jgi:hypothetical protein
MGLRSGGRGIWSVGRDVDASPAAGLLVVGWAWEQWGRVGLRPEGVLTARSKGPRPDASWASQAAAARGRHG